MPRYKITVEYDGTNYVGWQRQDNGPSIQQALEEAIHAFSGETVLVQGAGRTDSGVHALGQVAHLDLENDFETDTVRDAINFHIKPAPISVLQAEEVRDGFNARFDARERAYVYRIFNRRVPPALHRGRCWWVIASLDVHAMNDATKVLLGRHDFTTFRAVKCQAKTPVKTLDVLEATQNGNIIEVRARARSFMHHQVRILVGSLKLVGEGKWSKADLESALAKRNRTAGGQTAPAGGLFLTEVVYDDRHGTQS
jgi:tRNA pseudouridine38-40 synthase